MYILRKLYFWGGCLNRFLQGFGDRRYLLWDLGVQYFFKAFLCLTWYFLMYNYTHNTPAKQPIWSRSHNISLHIETIMQNGLDYIHKPYAVLRLTTHHYWVVKNAVFICHSLSHLSENYQICKEMHRLMRAKKLANKNYNSHVALRTPAI